MRSAACLDALQLAIEQLLAPLNRKVYAVVNYDDFSLDADLADDWAAMVRALVDRHYRNVARYSSSGFLRAKLGRALAARRVAPQLFDTADAAQQQLRGDGGCHRPRRGWPFGVGAEAPSVCWASCQIGCEHPCRGLWSSAGAGMLRPGEKAVGT